MSPEERDLAYIWDMLECEYRSITGAHGAYKGCGRELSRRSSITTPSGSRS